MDNTIISLLGSLCISGYIAFLYEWGWSVCPIWLLVWANLHIQKLLSHLIWMALCSFLKLICNLLSVHILRSTSLISSKEDLNIVISISTNTEFSKCLLNEIFKHDIQFETFGNFILHYIFTRIKITANGSLWGEPLNHSSIIDTWSRTRSSGI
jgi:hypothetical protein